jgi:lipopolysaccharide export LptBFGC system permease protein LptF
MALNYNHLVDVDSSQNSVIIQKFNKILERNNLNSNFKSKLDTINMNFEDDKTPYNEIINKIKWNTYYYKKYRHQTRMLFFIIFICILMIVLSKLRSPYFDEKAYSLVVGIILGISFIYAFHGLWDLLIKDDKNFDEYDYSIYGISRKNITELNLESKPYKPKCNPITPISVNSLFLNKYF